MQDEYEWVGDLNGSRLWRTREEIEKELKRSREILDAVIKAAKKQSEIDKITRYYFMY